MYIDAIQVLAAFREIPMRTFVDGTLGAGGHSAALLSEHSDMRLLIGIDKDPVAHAIAQKRLERAKLDAQSHVKLYPVLVRLSLDFDCLAICFENASHNLAATMHPVSV